jgi:hypothetical protein
MIMDATGATSVALDGHRAFGISAGLIHGGPEEPEPLDGTPVFAFDGDSVLFSGAADRRRALGSGSHSTKGGHDRYRPHRVHRISDLLDHNWFVVERSRPRDQAWVTESLLLPAFFCLLFFGDSLNVEPLRDYLLFRSPLLLAKTSCSPLRSNLTDDGIRNAPSTPLNSGASTSTNRPGSSTA